MYSNAAVLSASVLERMMVIPLILVFFPSLSLLPCCCPSSPRGRVLSWCPEASIGQVTLTPLRWGGASDRAPIERLLPACRRRSLARPPRSLAPEPKCFGVCYGPIKAKVGHVEILDLPPFPCQCVIGLSYPLISKPKPITIFAIAN